MIAPLLTRIDARDRALFLRFALGAAPRRASAIFWSTITHLGGARCSIGLCLAAGVLESVTGAMVWRALLVLGVSHAIVQVIKHLVHRERPSVGLSVNALIHVPDRFSFPSGHSCAAMAVALAFAGFAPSFAVPLLGLAMVVGLSRVMLGVHYPGDVVAGQFIALLTELGFYFWW